MSIEPQKAETWLLENVVTVDFPTLSVSNASVRIENGVIAEVANAGGHEDVPRSQRVNCHGMLLLPALVVGHTHLYSALAPGMPPAKRQPENFVQILEEIWWKLDRALDDEGVYYSALVGAIRAAQCGVGTLVDHHASPNAIAGSLDLVRNALARVGLRGVLCYEVTDRNGKDGARAGLEENARFIRNCPQDGRFSGLVGAHASFTLSDETLGALADLADETRRGVHIHCAEANSDNEDSLRRCGKRVLGRLMEARIVRPGTVLGHCTHLMPEEVEVAYDHGCWIAHNCRSNMNNAVGYAPIESLARGRLALGTDGIDHDLFAESRTAFFRMREARARLPFHAPLHWLTGASQLASENLGIPLGRVAKGYPADLLLLDYVPATPLTSSNFAGHWFFAINAQHVHSLMVGGKWILRNRELSDTTLQEELERARIVAQRMWQRFETL
ncbi:MAG: chlorohydrolase/aminohydrolase [Candidatus Sumerlaea sp.]|jgi:putative selenium metabolism protein SsnA|nr:MAG: chlorohydrolase/aminohydrolase [Candidatus Sumerlaea sp.]